ncbi:MAG: helix-turn-helix transcriptional regulator [Planctomycetes bacterium]|nr:helix-turn-helix transcriptional regulator [Planctomycetota bacterium]MCB9886190.1 helix-turn-helix transcriptional regulator [Planctomycetota bacterium]
MRRLHLKLFYLRTRLKREAQGVTAKILGVRPATMSHLEQGRSLPTLPMLLALCKHYDVTPTYLLDDARPIDPSGRDRWSERNNVVARGSWLEVAEAAMVTAHDGTRLAAVQPGARFFDAAAQAQRVTCPDAAAASQLEVDLQAASSQRDRELEETLSRELIGQRKPRTKPVAKSSLKAAMAQAELG